MTIAARLNGGSRRMGAALARAAELATSRFPVAALLVLAIATVANIEEARLAWREDWPRLLSALSAGAALSVAVRLAAEAHGAARRVLALLPAVAAASVASTIWFGEPLALYAPALIAASLAAIPLMPFLGRGSAAAFWTFTLWTGVGVALAFLSVLLFSLGLVAILEMVRFLFQIELGSRAYGHIFTTALTLVGPLFALGRIPEVEGEALVLRGDDALVRAVRSLFEWVAAPLALATAAILHLYGLRIVVTGELPLDEVGWIVSFFAILVLALRIGLDPFIATGAWPTRLFARVWAGALVFPLAILAYSALLRIGTEGFTVPRYFLVLGAAAAGVVVAAQLLRSARGDIRLVAAVPVLFLALSVAGPWSAANVVGRSQAARIAEGSLDDAGRLDLGRQDEAFRFELRSRISELAGVDQLWRLEPYLPADAEGARRLALAPHAERNRETILRVLGLWQTGTARERERSFGTVPSTPLDLTGYDIALFGQEPRQQRQSAEMSLPAFSGSTLVFAYLGVEDRVDLASTIASLSPDLFDQRPVLEAPVLDLTTAGGRRIRLRLEALNLDASAVPNFATVTILGRDAEWR